MHAVTSFPSAKHDAATAGETALAVGYLLLTAFLAGQLFKRIGLPRLTGYLFAGIIVGPYVLGLVSKGMLANVRIVNGVAISLIALTAGTEMRLAMLRPLLRIIGWLTLIGVIGTTVLLAVTVWLLQPLLPFMQGLDEIGLIAIAAVIGVATVAQSPAVVVALRDEVRADGPMTRVVMAVVVLADLVVISLFALATTIARGALGASADATETAGRLAWEIMGSAGAGAIVALLLALWLSKVRGGGALFVVGVCFVVAEVGERLHLDPLLVALTAGMLIRNLTEVADRLHHEIEQASLPVYVAFFAVMGATVHLDALTIVGLPAAIIVAVRIAGFWAGNNLAARVSKAPDVVRRWAGIGLMPQAGLALALAILFQRSFPDFGPDAAALVFAVVALNELIGPVLFRYALVRSGEAGGLDRVIDDQPTPIAAGSQPGHGHDSKPA
ncbi:MAG: cation:proton antiporter [Deltaproteobacteria bacterium]|nr:cation:proton antiporter [Deltaproteobacteria bacterium]